VGAAIGVATTSALAPKLRDLDHPFRDAVQIAGKGNLWAGRYVADALRRPWWPLAVAVGLSWRPSRPALAAAALVPTLIEWRERRPDVSAPVYVALRLLDDAAYGTGVWIGCLQQRTLRPLLPAFSGPVRPPTTSRRQLTRP
jgi:hypothetical protein